MAEHISLFERRLLQKLTLYEKCMGDCQKALCPDFGDCADQLADGERCACGFEDGPYGNAVPKNRIAEAMLAALRLCEQSLSSNLCPGNIEDTGENCLKRDDCGCDIGPALKATRAVIAAATEQKERGNG